VVVSDSKVQLRITQIAHLSGVTLNMSPKSSNLQVKDQNRLASSRLARNSIKNVTDFGIVLLVWSASDLDQSPVFTDWLNIMSHLSLLPCLDSEEIAELRRRELAISPDVAAALGWSALEAARMGFYVTQSGEKIDWHDAVEAACAAKISIPPDAVLPTPSPISFAETNLQVTNETTLGASSRLVERGFRPLALNFANGVQPGGGFLAGARAQEEALCRSSALYETLVGDPMYKAHRKRDMPDSSEWAIYSPDVPNFRKDDGTELETPWKLSFITCAAPYTPDVGQPLAGDLLGKRILRVLDIARAYGYTALVLGAWGCGAFENDPQRTANDFRQALEGDFRGVFAEIIFAITDWSPERRFLGPFRDVFATPSLTSAVTSDD